MTVVRDAEDGASLLGAAADPPQAVRVRATAAAARAAWSVPEKMEAWFSCREFVDVSVS